MLKTCESYVVPSLVVGDGKVCGTTLSYLSSRVAVCARSITALREFIFDLFAQLRAVNRREQANGADAVSLAYF